MFEDVQLLPNLSHLLASGMMRRQSVLTQSEVIMLCLTCVCVYTFKRHQLSTHPQIQQLPWEWSRGLGTVLNVNSAFLRQDKVFSSLNSILFSYPCGVFPTGFYEAMVVGGENCAHYCCFEDKTMSIVCTTECNGIGTDYRTVNNVLWW